MANRVFGSDPRCVFCRIISRQDSGEIIFENEKLIAFKDIYPASKTHFLVTPKNHIQDINSLSKDDFILVEEMKNIAKDLLMEMQIDIRTTRMGFHRPPFTSIKHLHLHAIAPISGMSFFQKAQFLPRSFWFTEIDDFLKNFKDAK